MIDPALWVIGAIGASTERIMMARAPIFIGGLNRFLVYQMIFLK